MSFVARIAAMAAVGVLPVLAMPVCAAEPLLWPPDAAPAAAAAITPNVLAERMLTAMQSVTPRAEAGIEVVDLDTGLVLAELDQDRPFYTASVVKLLIALDTLDRAGGQPDSTTLTAVQRMLSTSDDGIADRLWVAGGREEIITRMTALMGLTATSAPTDPGQWGLTRTTARDVATAYRYIATAATPSIRTPILDALAQISEIAADGVNQFFGIPTALPDSRWAVKQGWMWMNSSIVLNTTGLVGPSLRYAVVVLSSQPTTSLPSAGSALTAGVEVVHDTLTPRH